ncbi:E3 ubiquitin-protein ligase listerin (Listerin E3 ubiquitin protein ligase 1) (RING-type E3 ubiquitin transferase listerin), partial [Durusdinium trenchii]
AKSSGSGKAEDPKGGKKDGKKDGKKPAKDSKDGKKSTSKQQVYDYRPSGSADVFAQFAPYEERFVTLDDAEVQLALQALQKKDPTTRLRNVAELHQLLSTRPKSLLSDVCGPFLHTYLRLWPQDSEPGVREGLQRCLQVLVESLQRDFAKHLRSAFPTWLCAMFDTYTEVAQAARTAFAAAFASDEKRRNVFRHSLKECLELLTFYLRHNEQSLHEELGITRTKDKDLSLERQDRYARVLAASLSALGELVPLREKGSVAERVERRRGRLDQG